MSLDFQMIQFYTNAGRFNRKHIITKLKQKGIKDQNAYKKTRCVYLDLIQTHAANLINISLYLIFESSNSIQAQLDLIGNAETQT